MTDSTASVLTPKERRVNWAAFFLDYVFFGVGLAFANTNTTMPAFVARLTDNPIWIGLIGVVWSGGWMLPQIFAAHFLSSRPRKLPLGILVSWIGRPVFAFFAVYLWITGAQPAALALVLFFVASFIFTGTDSFVSVVWFDLLGKALAHEERGRLIGFGQIGSGLLSIAAGALVRAILDSPALRFPDNYAIIFLLADAGFLLSLVCFYFLREPVEPHAGEPQKMAEYLPAMVRLLFRDAAFLRVNASRLLVGFSGVAAPFLAIYALRALGLPEGSIGIFVAAQTMGSASAGVLLGSVADRRGAHIAIRIAGVVYLAAPLLALAAGALAVGADALTVCFAAVFFLIGMGDGSIMLGYLNYVLMIAPADQRPGYIGLTNTVMGIAILYPLLGGWIVETAGYPVVFLTAAAGIAVGALLGWTLPDPRKRTPATAPGLLGGPASF